MEFDISALGRDFQSAVDWMLSNKYGAKIQDDLKYFVANRNALETNADSEDALRLIVELKITNSWYRSASADYKSDFDTFIVGNRSDLRAKKSLYELAELILKHTIFQKGKVEEIAAWVETLLLGYPSIKAATDDMYESAIQWKKHELLGDKGRNNYLRDFGRWDVVPIDIHQQRFIIRSGIYHSFGTQDFQDPMENKSLSHAFDSFCKTCLGGVTKDGIDLGNNPGIVDIFVWSYSAKDRYAVCADNPDCSSCVVATSCLFELINT